MTQSPYGSWPGQQGPWQAPGAQTRPAWQQQPNAPAWQQPQGFGPAPSWQPAPGSYQAPGRQTYAAPAQPYVAPTGQQYAPGPSMLPAPPSQFGYPTGLQPQRREGGGKVILAVVGIVVLLGLGIAVINALSSGSTQAGGYVNESYTPPAPDLNPPALPEVTTVAQAKDTVTNDAIYAQTVPGPTLCQVTAIDLTTASSSELQAYMTKIVGCLMTVWNDPVTQAGYQLPRPPVIVYSSPITTGCGKLETENAVYCGADQKIYYATDLPSILPSQLQNARFVVEMIIAHEFGHAVQARTGILISFDGLESTATTTTEKNDWSRRGEMQADCLSGLFIRSVSQSAGLTQADLTNIAATARAVGDDTLSGKANIDGNHGLAANRQYWVQLGMASTKVSACNTFVAPADSVR